jgi:clostripain
MLRYFEATESGSMYVYVEGATAGSFSLNVELVGAQSVASTKDVTVIYYCDADNDLENYLLEDIQEMQNSFTDIGYNIIALVDRVNGYTSNSSILGENFTDTRLYKIGPNSAERIGGTSNSELTNITIDSNHEMNMGRCSNTRRLY